MVLAGEHPGQAAEREPGQLHRVLQVRHQALAGRRQLDGDQQRQHLGLARRQAGGPHHGGEPSVSGKSGVRAGARVRAKASVRAESGVRAGAGVRAQRGRERGAGPGDRLGGLGSHGGDLGGTRSVQTGQPGEQLGGLVAGDVEAGEVAGRAPLGQPADQRLTLQQGVG
jgi:hypothetical protein